MDNEEKIKHVRVKNCVMVKVKKTLRKNKMSGGKHCETLEKMNKELLELNKQLEFDNYPVPVGGKEYEDRLPEFRDECKSRIASLESDIQKHKNCKICNEVRESDIKKHKKL